VPTAPGVNGSALVSVGQDPIYLEWLNPRFLDVPEGSTFFTYIEYLAKIHAVSGFEDGTFRPGNPILRAHLTKMVVLAHAWPLSTKQGPHFTDVPSTSPFYPYVATAYSRGIIGGYSHDPFRL